MNEPAVVSYSVTVPAVGTTPVVVSITDKGGPPTRGTIVAIEVSKTAGPGTLASAILREGAGGPVRSQTSGHDLAAPTPDRVVTHPRAIYRVATPADFKVEVATDDAGNGDTLLVTIEILGPSASVDEPPGPWVALAGDIVIPAEWIDGVASGGNAFYPLEARVHRDGTCELRGGVEVLTGTPTVSPVVLLPPAFRPAKVVAMPITAFDALTQVPGLVLIDPSGALIVGFMANPPLGIAANDHFRLTGIRYPLGL